MWRYVSAHKIISVIVLAAVLFGGYWEYGNLTSTSSETRYVLSTVATGTIVASVSESGQVSTTNTVNIQPQVSGQITWVGVKAGDSVRAGQTLVTIDDTTALQTVAAAKQSLAASKLQYQQSQAQAPVSYQNDENTLATDKLNLQNDYNSSYNNLVSAYLNLPSLINGAQSSIYGYDFNNQKTQWNIDVLADLFTGQEDTTNVKAFKASSAADYQTADTAYTKALALYQQTPRTATSSDIDALLTQSVAAETDVAQSLQSALNFFGAVSDLAQKNDIPLPAKFSTVQASTRSYLTTANSDLTALLNDQKSLISDQQAIVNAQQAIKLDQVGNPSGDNPISLQISANSIQQQEQTLATDEANLADYTIVAPFAGTISAVTAQVGNNASGNLATIVSKSQIADLSLNEIDAAKIALGNKVTLTFDAITDLTLTGTVAEINPIGTVSQGVVSYDVQISFDTQDSRVKPGMTVNADIETAVHQNVLTVPVGAIKTQSGSTYVLAFTPPIADSLVTAAGSQGVVSVTAPQNIPVTVGISNTTNTEVTSGLTAGEQIVVRTTTGSASATKTAAATATTRSGFGGGPGGL